jgi:hypothetical protein
MIRGISNIVEAKVIRLRNPIIGISIKRIVTANERKKKSIVASPVNSIEIFAGSVTRFFRG